MNGNLKTIVIGTTLNTESETILRARSRHRPGHGCYNLYYSCI